MNILIGTITYNTKPFIELYLKTLVEAMYECRLKGDVFLEGMVIDNGSTDGTNIEELDDKYGYLNISFKRNEKNLGVSSGWNQLIKHGFDHQGKPLFDYYFICNSDIYWTKNSLINMVRCLKQNVKKEFGWISFFMNDYKEPNKTGVIETVNFERLYWSMRPHANSIDGVDHLEQLIDTAYGPWNGVENFSQVLENKYGIELKEMHPKASSFVVSKECIKQVGLFEEYNCPVGLHEDADYRDRIIKFSNYKFGAAYGAYIHHFSMMTRTRTELDDNGGWVNNREKAYQEKLSQPFKLDIGSGERPHSGPGWYHMDIDTSMPHVEYLHDCSQPLSFPDNLIEEIYCSNNLEHISWKKIPLVLKDWYRCLKPEGKIHIRVPNFRWLCEMYIHDSWKLSFDDKSELNVMHAVFGGDHPGTAHIHKAGFDFNNLYNLLSDVGFINIVDVSLNNSWELRVEAYK